MSVYFIQPGEQPVVKIGHAADPVARLAALQTAHYERLNIRRVIDGAEPEELWLHRKFGEHRIVGEWFKFLPQMMEIVPDLSVPPVPPEPPFVSDRRYENGLIACVDALCAGRKVARSTAGKMVLNDGKAFTRIASGGGITIRNFEHALRWLSANWPADAAWPGCVARPEPGQAVGEAAA